MSHPAQLEETGAQLEAFDAEVDPDSVPRSQTQRREVLSAEAERRWRLFLSHRKSLARLVSLLVDNPDDAADVLQELGLIVLRHATGPRDPSSFHAWCRVLARNLAANHWRAAGRRAAFTLLVEPQSGDSDASAASPEQLITLREQLDHLAEFDNVSVELLMRRYILGETATEIANTLRCSPAAVRMRLKRLRTSIRRAIETSHRTAKPA